jgi:quercetin dioxygenase-like cupin family protein
MYLTRIGTTPRRRAPIPGGPTMEVLVAAETSDNIAMVQVWIPPGGGLPEHDHGPSEIVLVHISGSIHLQLAASSTDSPPAPSHTSPPGNASV